MVDLKRAFLAMLVMAVALPVTVLAQDASAPADGTPGVEASTAQVQIILRPIDGLDGDRFEPEIKPGETTPLTVVIGNAGSNMLRVVTYTSDIRTRVNGGLALLGPESEQHEPTTWMEYPLENYEIEPGTEVHRDFTVSVPDGTEPGQYVIPIAVETVDSFAIEGNSQIRQKVRKIIPVYVTVPGDMTSEFSYGAPEVEFLPTGMNINVPITNTGDTTLRLEGSVTIKDPSGAVLVEAPITMGAFYRHHDTFVQVTLPTILPPADYLVSVSLTDAISGFAASTDDQVLSIGEPPAEAAPSVTFQSATIEPTGDPIQFAAVTVEIANTAQALSSSRLTLVVNKDGQHVEDFVLAENLQVPQGVTTVQQRYLPITGWESGTYTFSLKLESTEGGTVSPVLAQDDVATITVP